MDANHRIILGRCSKSPQEKGFGFVEVLAEYVDDRLQTFTNIEQEFPSNGSVWLWSSPGSQIYFDSLNIWSIGPNEKVDRSKTPYSEYSIDYPYVPLATPIEVIRLLGVNSEEELRNRLLTGIFLPFSPSPKLLIELENGSVVGPVKLNWDIEARVWRIDEKDLSNPLEYRTNLLNLNEASIVIKNRSRRFLGVIDLPEKDGYFDCASPTEKLRSILNHTRKMGLVEISKKTVQQITDIAELIENPIVSSRCKEGLKILEYGCETLDYNIRPIVESALECEPFSSEKRNLLDSMVQQEISKVRNKHSDLIETTNKLEKKKKELENHVTRLEKRFETVNRETEETFKSFKENIQNAVKNTGEVLAQVALLKPFIESGFNFETNDDCTDTSNREQVIIVNDRDSNLKWTTIHEVLSALEDNLKTVGASSKAASDLSLMITASFLERNYPILSGSTSVECFTAITNAISSSQAMIISVGLGWNNSDELISRVVSHSNSRNNESPVPLLISDINLSPTEAYLFPAISQMRMRNLHDNFNICFTLSNGGIALPLPSNAWDFGPSIELEVWLTRITPNVSNMKYGAIDTAKWLEWGKMVENKNLPSEFLDLLSDLENKGMPFRLAHRRNIQNIYSRLIHLECEEERAIKLILTGWILPLLNYSSIDTNDMLAALKLYWSNDDPVFKKIEKIVRSSDRHDL